MKSYHILFIIPFLLFISSCNLEEIPSEYLTASFEFVINNNNYAPATITFTNKSIYADSYSWNFGDPGSGADNTSTDEDPTHLYSNPGIYTVTLIATNSNSGDNNETTKTVTIEAVTTFERFYEVAEDQIAFNIARHPAGGFALVGQGESGAQNDVYLVLTDENGDELNTSPQHYGSNTEYDVGFEIISTETGGYAIIGYTDNGTDNDVYLVITDQNGNLISQKSYGGINNQCGYGITRNSDGGFAITGYSDNGSDNDVYLIITDQNGNLLSERTFGGSNDENGLSIVETNNGGYAIFGFFDDGSETEYYLVLIDENLNELPGSPSIYPHAGTDISNNVVKTNAGYALMGYSGSIFGGNIYVIFIDQNGNKLQEKTFAGQRSIMNIRGGIVFTGEGYAITGFLNNGADDDVYLTLTDMNGNELPGFPKTYERLEDQYGSGIVITDDGGYAIAGYTNEASDPDVLLIKTDANGNVK